MPAPRRKRNIRLALVLWTLSIALSLSPRALQNTVRAYSFNLMSPLLAPLAAGTQGLGNLSDRLRSLWPDAEENQRLRRQVRSLENKLVQSENRIRQLEHKLKKLEAYLETFPEHVMTHIPGDVITRDPSLLYESLWINRGHHHGVEKGQAVLAGDALVGIISNAGMRSSQVTLIVDPAFKVRVLVGSGANRYQGVLEGNKGTDDCWIRIKYLSAETELALGDPVLTSGYDRIFPRGIVIGKISRIEQPPNSLWAKVEVAPMVEMISIESVIVLKPQIRKQE